MTARLYSLPAFRKAQQMGDSKAEAARLSRHVATELAQDGMLDADPRAPSNQSLARECLGHLMEAEAHDASMRSAGTVAAPPEAPARQPAHPQLVDYGGSYNYAVGSKFTKDLGLVEIAKLVRKEIKERVKKGEFPRAQYSVRISRYSMGQALTVRVGDVDPGFLLLNPDRILEERARPHDLIPVSHFPRYTEEGQKFLSALEAIPASYNYDRSDSQTDFYDNNFHLSVDLDGRWEEQARAAIIASATG